jgi:hypothetical protein
MALDPSFGLHVICVRVGAGHKRTRPQMGYLLEFMAFIMGTLVKEGGLLPRGVTVTAPFRAHVMVHLLP